MAACAALFMLASPAEAARCNDRDTIIRGLAAIYGEHQLAWAQEREAQGGVVIEIWANTIKGTFSILRVLPNGWTCVIEWGVNFTKTEKWA